MTKSRVIVENLQPVVDGGRYPAKRTVGERVDVTASVFGDGHDHIRARVHYRHEHETGAHSLELVPGMNDDWSASFYVTQVGRYTFQVEAWIDHFDTWFDGFRKKTAANLEVSLELQEGAAHLNTVAVGDPSLVKLAEKLADRQHYADAVALVLSPAFGEIVRSNPRVQHAIRSPEFTIVVEHKRALYSTWYELFPRSAGRHAGKHGTFQDCIRLLPRIVAMGFDVLYLPPIHPIGKVNRKGKNNSITAQPGEPGSPWAIGSDEGGHKAILAELGTLNDYKRLIAEAKKVGVDVALDIAFQCAPDHPYVTEHPDWFTQRPDGSIQYAENPPKKYQDIYPFNFESDDWEALWNELKSVVLYWIAQGVSIFRVDNPHTKPIAFWEWLIAEVNRAYPEVIFLAEAFTRPRIMASLAKSGFTQGYTYFTWRVTKEEIMAYMNELVSGPMRNYFRPNFWPNTPDILPYHLQHQGENSFILRYALAATLSSNTGIYGPAYEFCDSIPVEGREEYFNSEKYEIREYDWKRTNRMTDIIAIVNRARRENPALQSTWNLRFCGLENPNLIAYLKATDDLSNIILVVVNLDPHRTHSGYVQIPVHDLRLGAKINLKLLDVMTDERYTWTQEWNFVELNPNKMPFHLFKVEIHESNM
jgi:starch synthase (maltosyl-transferring)